MRTPAEIQSDFPSDLELAEVEQMVALALRLEAEAPSVSPGFRVELRRQLIGERDHRPVRTPSRGTMALAYAVCGAFLLLIAAVGLVGAGPFAHG